MAQRQRLRVQTTGNLFLGMANKYYESGEQRAAKVVDLFAAIATDCSLGARTAR